MANIVLIEDDPLLSEMYTARLRAEGHTCQPILDGAAGLTEAQNTLPDLVLLDLMLPQMSGDQVLAELRKDEKTKDIKVIIMTNISYSEAPDILRTLKFERYLVKANTTLDLVVNIVEDTLEQPETAEASTAS